MSGGHPWGYCWSEHPEGGPRCTLEPGHEGDHHDWYARGVWRDWPNVPAPVPAAGAGPTR